MHSYEDMYPPVGVEFLRSLYMSDFNSIESIISNSLCVDETINQLDEISNAVSISIFLPKNLGNNHSQGPINDGHRSGWITKYYNSFIENLDGFEAGFDTCLWKLIVYTCPHSLSQLRPEYDLMSKLASYKFVEIRVMKNPSPGLAPGTLWRFLPISDLSLNSLLIYDIDEPWYESINTWYKTALKYSKSFTRAHHLPREKFWLRPNSAWFVTEDGSIRNYATVLASKILVQPEKFGVADIDKLMGSYIWLRKLRAESANPFSQVNDQEPINPYNRPIGHHCYGFGNHWHHYCFDERFLKHVIYPYAARNGALCTYCLPQDVTEDLLDYLIKHGLWDFLADFAYSQRMSEDNIIVNNNNIVVSEFKRYGLSTKDGASL